MLSWSAFVKGVCSLIDIKPREQKAQIALKLNNNMYGRDGGEVWICAGRQVKSGKGVMGWQRRRKGTRFAPSPDKVQGK